MDHLDVMLKRAEPQANQLVDETDDFIYDCRADLKAFNDLALVLALLKIVVVEVYPIPNEQSNILLRALARMVASARIMECGDPYNITPMALFLDSAISSWRVLSHPQEHVVTRLIAHAVITEMREHYTVLTPRQIESIATAACELIRTRVSSSLRHREN